MQVLHGPCTRMHLPTFGRYSQDMETLRVVQGYPAQFQLMMQFSLELVTRTLTGGSYRAVPSWRFRTV